MSKPITSELLRDAAAVFQTADGRGVDYLCWAVARVEGSIEEFTTVLIEYGLYDSGILPPSGWGVFDFYVDRQVLRFDLLNLLAEVLDAE